MDWQLITIDVLALGMFMVFCSALILGELRRMRRKLDRIMRKFGIEEEEQPAPFKPDPKLSGISSWTWRKRPE